MNLGVALSRDGTRTAASYSRQSPLTRAGLVPTDIWLHEFARNTSTPFTSDPAPDAFPTWSPDGSRIIFSSPRGSAWDLYQKNSNGAGNEELLFKSSDAKYAQDWSRDGRFLLYSGRLGGGIGGFGGDNDLDLWVLPLTPGNTPGNPADRKPEPYLKTGFSESQGKFSPDGRFVAYRSDASGRDEIYVQPFPVASGDKVTVSTGGVTEPRWRGDGKEILYISADSKMMAVEVSTNPVFKAGIPKALFASSIAAGVSARNVTLFDVTADGKKFLIISTLATAGNSAPITVVLNWTALLKK